MRNFLGVDGEEVESGSQARSASSPLAGSVLRDRRKCATFMRGLMHDRFQVRYMQ